MIIQAITILITFGVPVGMVVAFKKAEDEDSPLAWLAVLALIVTGVNLIFLICSYNNHIDDLLLISDVEQQVEIYDQQLIHLRSAVNELDIKGDILANGDSPYSEYIKSIKEVTEEKAKAQKIGLKAARDIKLRSRGYFWPIPKIAGEL